MVNEYSLFDELYNKNRDKVRWLFLNSEAHPSNDFVSKVSRVLSAKGNSELSRIMAQINDLSLLQYFSPLRSNLISWLPYTSSDNVLVVGEDVFGFVEGLATKCHVSCISPNQLHLLALAEKQYENVELICNRIDKGYDCCKKFDYIIFSDFVKIPIRKTIDDCEILMLISAYKGTLKDGGSIVFAAENAMGLKYWSGCKDSVTGLLWSSIEGYPTESSGNPTLSKLKQIVENSYFKYYKLFFPYPDCWFPTSIYSEDYLPEIGELNKNAFAWEHRTHLFNEVNAWNNIIDNHRFMEYSNGFLVIMSNEQWKQGNQPIFSKFSNDRADLFSIRTDISIDLSGEKHVVKQGCTNCGEKHLEKLLDIERQLKDTYSNANIDIQNVKALGNRVELEFLEGKSLSTELKNLLENGKEEEFVRLFSEFANILQHEAVYDFCKTTDFIEVFGNVSVPVGLRCSKITDIDLIVTNVILRSNRFGIIDYEWTFDFPIPINFVIYRSIEYLFKGPRNTSNHNSYYKSCLLDKYGIDEDQCRIFAEMEMNFQNYTCREHVPMRKFVSPVSIQNNLLNTELFLDYGTGFSRANKYHVAEELFDKNSQVIKIGITDGIKRIRLDPTDTPCIINMVEVIAIGSNDEAPAFRINGMNLSEKVFLCASNDPQIIISDIGVNTIQIIIRFEIVELSNVMAQSLARKMGADS